MAIEWIADRTLVLVCPVCTDASPKSMILSVESTAHGGRRLTLVRCPRCGCAFYDDLTPARYEECYSNRVLKFLVEQGIGVDVMLGPLFRFPQNRVRTYLDVGCGFGYSLDFARFAFGWKVCGIDPSIVAAAGREALQLDITSAYLTADTDLGGTRFDLILCSELIEHVPNPHEFLQLVQQRLAERGALTLTTPNAAALNDAESSRVLLSILGLGGHLILFSKAALERVLKANGFEYVQVWEYPYTLHAVASRHACVVRKSATVDHALYRRYLADRSAAIPTETPVGLGFAYRLFKECVKAGDYTAAEPVFERLRVACSTVYGLDLLVPESIPSDFEAAGDFDAFARTHPFNLTGTLYFRAIIEMSRPDHKAALQYFQAAARVGVTIRTALRSIAADDGETENLVALARIHAVYCLASLHPTAALSELEALSDPSPDAPPAEVWSVPAELLPAVRAEVFVRLVHAGWYAEAAQLADTVAAALGVATESALVTTARVEGDPETALKSLFCLGMLALNYEARVGTAANLFGLVYRLARTAYATRQPSGAAANLIWQARYHEALALQRAGDQRACEAVIRSVVDECDATLPKIDEALLAAARRLVS